MTRARVLVVDDEPDIVELVRVDLERAGYTVTIAVDGEGALEELRADPPDLVLLDVLMPRLDGWQVLAEMQRDARLADVPVVMLTALGGERERIRSQLLGAVRYVGKPFALDVLLRTIDEALTPVTADVRSERRTQLRALLGRLADLQEHDAIGPGIVTPGSARPGLANVTGVTGG